MFTPVRKWVFKPYDNSQWTAKPIEGLMYGEWKLEDRYVELECHSGCQCPHFNFDFIEKRHLAIVKDGLWSQINQDYKILSIAFYPEPYSDQDVALVALGEGDLRGRAEQAAVYNAFRFFFKDNFDSSKKMISGRFKGNGNPLPIFFPEWWNWWVNLKVG